MNKRGGIEDAPQVVGTLSVLPRLVVASCIHLLVFPRLAKWWLQVSISIGFGGSRIRHQHDCALPGWHASCNLPRCQLHLQRHWMLSASSEPGSLEGTQPVASCLTVCMTCFIAGWGCLCIEKRGFDLVRPSSMNSPFEGAVVAAANC